MSVIQQLEDISSPNLTKYKPKENWSLVSSNTFPESGIRMSQIFLSSGSFHHKEYDILPEGLSSAL